MEAGGRSREGYRVQVTKEGGWVQEVATSRGRERESPALSLDVGRAVLTNVCSLVGGRILA